MRLITVISLSMLMTVCVAPTALAQSAFDQPARPHSGIGALVVGYSAIGVGALNLATIPICFIDLYPSDLKNACIGVNAAIGVGGIALGVPLIIMGHLRRARYRQWRQSRMHGVVKGLDLTLSTRGASVRYGASF